MTRLLVALFAVVVLAACVPPQLIPPRIEIPCNSTPGYSGPERCVLWQRLGITNPDEAGQIVHGPYWQYAFENSLHDAILVEEA
jgi:hypothetical protein